MLANRFAISTGRSAPLGARIDAGGTNLAVLSRHAEQIWVCIFYEEDDREIARLPLPGRSGDVHHGFVSGLAAGMHYGLRAEGLYDPAQGHLFDPAKLLVDPYATALNRPFAWHPDLAAPRSAARDTAHLVPRAIVTAPMLQAPRPAPRQPGFIYEIAVKAFSHRHPDVPQALRGTVAALTHPRVIEHLQRIAVDTVELMPIAAWIDERHLPALGLSNGWGYNPVTFMAPDPRLAPGGLAEVRGAVQALQDAGMRVLLDIVLNHTGESDMHGATLSLRGLDNALYFRHSAQDPGTLVNDTGCGNTLALDRAPVVQLAADTLRHWAGQTGVDGFRFDLATVLGRTDQGFDSHAPLFKVIEQDALLSGLTYIAEPWDIGAGGYRLGQFPSPWHEWNDRYRDDVRRFWRGREGGAGQFATRLAGSSDIFAMSGRPPSRSINFIAAHDGFTLRDLVSYEAKHNQPNGEGNRDGSSHEISWNNGAEGPSEDAGIKERRQRDQHALLATLMLSRGTPMVAAGDEFGRTQQGNNNAYAQDNETTWLDWANADGALINFLSQLAQFRRGHPAISADRLLTGATVDGSGIPDAEWLRADGGPMAGDDWGDKELSVLGLALYEPPSDAVPADRLCLWFNRGDAAATVTPPEAREGFAWRRLLDSSGSGLPDDGVARSEGAIVSGRSVVVLAEAAGIGGGKSRKADDATISRLAAAAGIHDEWWQVDGTHHRVSIETKRALLKAMRLPGDTLSDARASLLSLQRRRDLRVLPAVQLLQANSPGSMRLALPERFAARSLPLDIRSEDGSVQRIIIAPAQLEEIHRANIAGERVRNLRVPLPAMPAGYHEAALEEYPEESCRFIVGPPACYLHERIADGARLFGLTTHLYALRHPTDTGIGDFETLAQFCETSARLGGSFAGINPLHYLFPGDRERASPYQPSDRRFIDPIYIDLGGVDALLQSPRMRAVLAKTEAAVAALRGMRHVDYAAVWAVKREALSAAFADFSAGAGHSLRREFESFKQAGGGALRLHGAYESPAGKPDSTATNAAAAGFHTWLQWLAERQFAAAAERARAAGLELGIYRDLALGAARDSGELRASPDHYAAGVSLGAPPDPFARDGQVWQLAPFEPHALADAQYDPFIVMLRANMRHAGLLRIDHILGYMRQFWVPDGAAGRDGAYVTFPLEELIAVTAIESHRARCTIIGEDLGTVPPGLRECLAQANILSYRVLWWERDGDRFLPPENYPPLSVSCLSSHDLPTFAGWRQGRDIEIRREAGQLDATAVAANSDARSKEEAALRQALAQQDISAGDSDAELMTAAHELLAKTRSALVLIQADDLLQETEPLNVPGTDRERPNWRRRLSAPVGELSGLPLAKQIAAAVKRGRNDGK
ncbi:MAG: glycogen debranching protein GlgX [Dongiaceae bacterium]